MPGFGTLLNALAIIFGGMLGIVFRSKLNAALQENLVRAVALCCLFIGIEGALEQAMSIVDGGVRMQGTMMVLASFVIGTLVGSWLGIEAQIVKFGQWLKHKTGSEADKQFVTAFVTTSLTVCIGAMAVVGAIEDGISHEYSILAAFLATLIEPYLTPQAISNLSLVGSMMIFCVGVNIIWETKFRVADMLPALVVAVVWEHF